MNILRQILQINIHHLHRVNIIFYQFHFSRDTSNYVVRGRVVIFVSVVNVLPRICQFQHCEIALIIALCTITTRRIE